jgi:hypothetical protein
MSQAQERRAEERVDELKDRIYKIECEIAGHEAALIKLNAESQSLQAQLMQAMSSSSY